MNDLNEFLRARLDEDAAEIAKHHPGNDGLLEPDGLLATTESNYPCDPYLQIGKKRALAEVDAKRRTLDVVESWRHRTCEDSWYSCSQATEANGYSVDVACSDDDRAGTPCDCGLERRQRAILAPMTLPYADHPDYRPEWRP